MNKRLLSETLFLRIRHRIAEIIYCINLDKYKIADRFTHTDFDMVAQIERLAVAAVRIENWHNFTYCVKWLYKYRSQFPEYVGFIPYFELIHTLLTQKPKRK